MLVLTRKLNEKIRVGDDIIVTIIQIDKGSVKIGFEAPGNVAIYRNEVYDKIQSQDRQAAADGETP